MRRFLRFRLSAFLMFIAMCAIALGWWRDRENLLRQLDESVDVDHFAEALEIAAYTKQHARDGSSMLGCGTDAMETQLKDYLGPMEGEFTTSRGWGEAVRLRKPSKESALKVVAVLDHHSASVRADAARLVALYGEAFRWGPLSDSGPERDALKALSAEATPKLLPLLRDADPEIRAAAAIALGYLAPRYDALKELVRAYRREEDQTMRLRMAWAVQRKFVD